MCRLDMRPSRNLKTLQKRPPGVLPPAHDQTFCRGKCLQRRDSPAEQSCVRFVLRHFDGWDRRPVHPGKSLEVAAIIENRFVLGSAKLLAFATAAFTIFSASSEEMLSFFTTSGIGYLPSFVYVHRGKVSFRRSFRRPR